MSRISPWVNPATGDLELKRGSIINKNTLETLLFSRLITPKGGWLMDLTFGNALTEEVFSGNEPRQQIQRSVQAALKDLVTGGYVRNIVVVVPINGYTVKSVQIDIFVTDNLGNEPQKFTWSLTP